MARHPTRRPPPVLPEPLEGRTLPAGVTIVDGTPRTPTAFLLLDREPPYTLHVFSGGAGPYTFRIAFADDHPMDESSVRDNPLAVRVVGPNGYDAAPRLARTAYGAYSYETSYSEVYDFEMPAPGGRWDPSDDGVYTVRIGEGQIKDADGNVVPAGDVGTITAAIAAHGPDVRASGEVKLRKAARPGARLPVRLTLSNLGDGRLRGDVRIGVGLVSASAPPGTVPDLRVTKYRFLFHTTLHAGRSKRFALRLGVPGDLAPGEYRLVAWAECVDEVETDAFNNATDGENVVVQASLPALSRRRQAGSLHHNQTQTHAAFLGGQW